MDPCSLSLLLLREALADGTVSARAAAEAYLARIAAYDGALGAFITVDESGALAAAQAHDQRRARGEPLGALSGVPLALKDIFVTRDLKTTCGSQILADWVPPFDGTVVERLKQAGAVILGKLNMDEFAMGSSTERSAFFPCRNPWDLSRVPGGSSGGSAAAVSARLCAASLGTDTGGSIRQPAALTGVVGIKPTYGRVSRYGVIAYASSFDQVGPLGRTVRDCALLLEVIAGHDPKDSTSIQAPAGAYLAACGAGVRGLRIGMPREFFGEGLDPQVERAVQSACATLEGLGATLVEVSLPHTAHSVAAYYLIAMAEASSNLARYDGVRFGYRAASATDLLQMYEQSRTVGFGPEVRRRIMLGTFALSAGYYDAYYGKAQRARALIAKDFAEAFTRCDLLATPTSPVPAFRLGERLQDPVSMYLADVYTTSCNMAGLPGLSLPCGTGTTDDGAVLPVGLQLLGPEHSEEAIFRAAAAYEDHTPWHTLEPRAYLGPVSAAHASEVQL